MCHHWWTSPQTLPAASLGLRYQKFHHPSHILRYWKEISTKCNTKQTSSGIVIFKYLSQIKTPGWIFTRKEHNWWFCPRIKTRQTRQTNSHFVIGFIHAVSQSSSSRFVNDPENIQPWNLSSIFCGLIENKHKTYSIQIKIPPSVPNITTLS